MNSHVVFLLFYIQALHRNQKDLRGKEVAGGEGEASETSTSQEMITCVILSASSVTSAIHLQENRLLLISLYCLVGIMTL